jgi:hypothetical protein
MTELFTELRAYNHHLDSMLPGHNGDYVVIKGTQTVHFSPTYEDALTWGYTTFGLDRFFVKRVAADHDVAHFSRNFESCRN